MEGPGELTNPVEKSALHHVVQGHVLEGEDRHGAHDHEEMHCRALVHLREDSVAIMTHHVYKEAAKTKCKQRTYTDRWEEHFASPMHTGFHREKLKMKLIKVRSQFEPKTSIQC